MLTLPLGNRLAEWAPYNGLGPKKKPVPRTARLSKMCNPYTRKSSRPSKQTTHGIQISLVPDGLCVTSNVPRVERRMKKDDPFGQVLSLRNQSVPSENARISDHGTAKSVKGEESVFF